MTPEEEGRLFDECIVKYAGHCTIAVEGEIGTITFPGGESFKMQIVSKTDAPPAQTEEGNS